MKEYRVKVTVRNNLLLSAIESAGYKSQAEFARSCGLYPSELNNLVAMREAPIGERGAFSDAAKTIMEALGAAPSDLWTDEQLTMNLKRNTGEREFSSSDVSSLLASHVEAMTLPNPEDQAARNSLSSMVNGVLDYYLTPRQRRVVKLVYEEDMSLEEAAKECGVSVGAISAKLRSVHKNLGRLEVLQKATLDIKD